MLSSVQAVIASARTLQDINEDRVVPGDFLGVLLLLFFFMVLDRLFYTLGLHFGKVSQNPSLWKKSNFHHPKVHTSLTKNRIAVGFQRCQYCSYVKDVFVSHWP